MPEISYPFIPKSTRWLIPGQFWAVPLSNGQYGCGRVIDYCYKPDGQHHSRHFIAGLLDWSSKNIPTSESIAGKSTIAQGKAHINTILENGRDILGVRSLEADGIEPMLCLSNSGGGPGCMVQRGAIKLRKASLDEQRRLPTLTMWGMKVISVLAETRFVRNEAIPSCKLPKNLRPASINGR